MKKIFLLIASTLFLSNISAKTYNYGNSGTFYCQPQVTNSIAQKAKNAVKIQSEFDFTEITLPYGSENLPFNEENVQRTNFDMLGGQEYPFVGYSFSLTEAKNLYVSSNRDIFIVICNSPTLTQESVVVGWQPKVHTDIYPRLYAGTYYMFVIYPETGINYSLYVQPIVMETDYTRLDYNKYLSVETPVYGKITNDSPMLYTPNASAFGSYYKLILEPNKTYNIDFTLYINEPRDNFWAFIELINKNFESLQWFRKNSDNTTANISYYYSSPTTDTILVYCLSGIKDVLYKINTTEITDTQENYISVAELLTNATEITNLPYSDKGKFDENSTLVIGDDRDFQASKYKYYATAYKMTFAENQKINIYSYLQSKAFIMIYKAGGIDGYTYVDKNTEYNVQKADDAYLEFTAPADGIYYIIARSYAAYNFSTTGLFYIDVWANGTMQPDNEYKNLTVTSLSAKETHIYANKSLSDTEIILLLSDLNITGTTNNGVEVPIANNPFAWETGKNGNTVIAYFYPSDSRYTIDESLYVTVTIELPVSGINDILTDKEILKEEYFSIDGKPLRAKDISPLRIKRTVYKDGTVKITKTINP